MFWRPTCGTVAFPADSLAEAELVKALEKVVADTDGREVIESVIKLLYKPEAVENPEGITGSKEADTVTEFVTKLLDEPDLELTEKKASEK